MEDESKRYYCDYKDCKYANCSWTGDGYHEPREMDFSCSREDYLDDGADYTNDPKDEQCPEFSLIEYSEEDIEYYHKYDI